MNQTQPCRLDSEDRAAIEAADTVNARFIAMLVFAVLTAYAVLYTFKHASAGSECLRAGWPHGKVDMMLVQYCVRFDTVVPLQDIRRP